MGSYNVIDEDVVIEIDGRGGESLPQYYICTTSHDTIPSDTLLEDADTLSYESNQLTVVQEFEPASSNGWMNYSIDSNMDPSLTVKLRHLAGGTVYGKDNNTGSYRSCKVYLTHPTYGKSEHCLIVRQAPYIGSSTDTKTYVYQYFYINGTNGIDSSNSFSLCFYVNESSYDFPSGAINDTDMVEEFGGNTADGNAFISYYTETLSGTQHQGMSENHLFNNVFKKYYNNIYILLVWDTAGNFIPLYSITGNDTIMKHLSEDAPKLSKINVRPVEIENSNIKFNVLVPNIYDMTVEELFSGRYDYSDFTVTPNLPYNKPKYLYIKYGTVTDDNSHQWKNTGEWQSEALHNIKTGTYSINNLTLWHR